jgi:hypothetical protein
MVAAAYDLWFPVSERETCSECDDLAVVAADHSATCLTCGAIWRIDEAGSRVLVWAADAA